MLVFEAYLVLLSGLVAWLTVPVLGTLLPMPARPKFDEMHAFLSSKAGFVGSWNHLILSDLWIGRWVAHDSVGGQVPLPRANGLPAHHSVRGPMGLFCYLMFRMISRRKLALTDVEPRNLSVV